MKTTRRRAVATLAVFLFACLTFGSGLLVMDAGRNEPIRIVKDGDWGKALRQCWTLGGRTYDSPAGKCIFDVIYQSATEGKILDASRAVTEYAAENYEFYGTCHRVVHTLGEKLYRFYGDIADAITAVNSRDCGTGLAHGVVDYWTTLGPTDDEYALAVAACDKVYATRFGGCPEALGHAAYQRLPADYPDRFLTAFNSCKLFQTDETQWTCAYGVMMQPYFKQNPIITEKEIPVPDWNELISICARIESAAPVRHGCYSGGGWMMGLSLIMTVVPTNPGEVPAETMAVLFDKARQGIRVCSTISESDSRIGCTQQVLARMPNAWYKDLDALQKRCGKIRAEFGDIVGDFCLSGAWEFTPPDKMANILKQHPSLVSILGPKLKGQG